MTAEPAAPDPPVAEDPTPSGIKALTGRGREQLAASHARIEALLERHKDHPVIDIGLRIYQRDREAAGTVGRECHRLPAVPVLHPAAVVRRSASSDSSPS